MRFANAVFCLMLATLFTHELDAMAQSEWRLLYVLRSLPPADGQFWFVLLHVPLFAGLLWLTQQASPRVRLLTQLSLATFALVHAGLHYRLSTEPLYTFTSPLSLTVIYGAAVLGALFLILSWHKLLEPSSRQ
ncbi:MAG: DUF6713 family protein [Pseudomonadota bacterium]